MFVFSFASPRGKQKDNYSEDFKGVFLVKVDGLAHVISVVYEF